MQIIVKPFSYAINDGAVTMRYKNMTTGLYDQATIGLGIGPLHREEVINAIAARERRIQERTAQVLPVLRGFVPAPVGDKISDWELNDIAPVVIDLDTGKEVIE